MKKINYSSIVILIGGIFLASNFFCQDKREETKMQNSEPEIIQLPAPASYSSTSIEEALRFRRSVREYRDEPLALADISQILWAAQGITEKDYGLRTAPSAGALYPLELYLVAANVEGIPQGIYKYVPQKHTLVKTIEGDKRFEISNAALRQEPIEIAPALVVITAVVERTAVKYGRRAERYVHMEVGHTGQNIYLQAVSLGIGTVIIGAFTDDDVKKVLKLQWDEQPLAIMPLGKI